MKEQEGKHDDKNVTKHAHRFQLFLGENGIGCRYQNKEGTKEPKGHVAESQSTKKGQRHDAPLVLPVPPFTKSGRGCHEEVRQRHECRETERTVVAEQEYAARHRQECEMMHEEQGVLLGIDRAVLEQKIGLKDVVEKGKERQERRVSNVAVVDNVLWIPCDSHAGLTNVKPIGVVGHKVSYELWIGGR